LLRRRATKELAQKSRRHVGSMAAEELAEEVSKLTAWLDLQLSLGTAPRVQDIYEHAKRSGSRLKKKQVSDAVRLHPAYNPNSHQQREALGSRKERPILTNALGMLHCDLAFYPVVREYSTPKSFRHGFLVARDILSRYTYLELLGREASAKTLIGCYTRLLAHHAKFHPDYPVLSLGWDKEPSIRSGAMKEFLRKRNIQLVLFGQTRSKAKVAENCIRLIRTKIARLMRDLPRRRWWSILKAVADELNGEEIVVGGYRTGYAPRDVNTQNLPDFISQLHKGVPAYYFAQFKTFPRFVKFKFKVGDLVRPKTSLASSQVIGSKRSAVNLQPQLYKIVSLEPFTTKDLNTRALYKCIDTKFGDVEIFSEQDIALSF